MASCRPAAEVEENLTYIFPFLPLSCFLTRAGQRDDFDHREEETARVPAAFEQAEHVISQQASAEPFEDMKMDSPC
ncbi:uncharacterized protein FFFS_15892 [Fusarium fujikuroi]|nr:uncharacterized protein FFFS_15892 [Fusarium fujikuroi]